MERSGGIWCRSKSKAAVGQASGGSKLGGAAAVACGLWSQKAGLFLSKMHGWYMNLSGYII